MSSLRVQPIKLLQQRGLRRAQPVGPQNPDWRQASGPLGQVFQALSNSSRRHAASLHEELLVFEDFNPEWLHVAVRPAERPLVDPLMSVWLPRLQQESDKSVARDNSEPHGCRFSRVLRQLAVVLDVRVPELLLGPAESRLYMEMQNDLQMVAHPNIGSLSPQEFRFVALRAFFHHYQGHGDLWNVTRAWDSARRLMMLNLFWVWNLRFGKPILREHWAKGQTVCERLVPLSQWLNRMHDLYPTAAVHDLRELLVRPRPFDREFRTQANMFACAGTDTVTACYALARCALPQTHWDQLETQGLGVLQGELQGVASPIGSEQIQGLLSALWGQFESNL